MDSDNKNWLTYILVALGVGFLGVRAKKMRDEQKEFEAKEAERRRIEEEQRRMEEEERLRREAEQRRIEQQRVNTPVTFNHGASREDFLTAVYEVTKRIKRLEVKSVEGAVIKAVVRSQSAISCWSFTLDFNDFGSVTGRYWLWKDNYDSDLPRGVAEQISTLIKQKINT